MIIKVNKKVGGATAQFEIEEKDNKDALALMTFLSEPDYCFVCKDIDIKWESNKAQTDNGSFIYIKRRCLNSSCRATSTMGENKGGGYFWKKWEIYDPNMKPADMQTQPKYNENEPASSTNIPF